MRVLCCLQSFARTRPWDLPLCVSNFFCCACLAPSHTHATHPITHTTFTTFTPQDICKKYNIPTAAYESFRDPAAAKAYIQSQGAPIVVKTSGLAAGKGVIVAGSVEEACQAVDDMMVNSVFGDAGRWFRV